MGGRTLIMAAAFGRANAAKASQQTAANKRSKVRPYVVHRSDGLVNVRHDIPALSRNSSGRTLDDAATKSSTTINTYVTRVSTRYFYILISLQFHCVLIGV